ncbi:vesicle-associated protein 1-3-like isoform X1 [Salvia miltiorrhiza]|uniref:vesicle-associated protein 1-3-like isoform X1 n=1 Tax=Salvia miltiorrhiza TaxID=226208 RepID=UPI0025ABC3E7|nr:vesicle-associated protein 1-3-like isoform X1 [Salvia miltiorrhiza]
MRRQQLLRVEPREKLVFRIEQRGEASSTFRIWNDSQFVVAFKVMTTNRLRFSGNPSYGILIPGSYRDVDVTVHGQGESLYNMQHGDRVTIKSLRASRNDTVESIRELFRERAHMVEDYKLRVVYALSIRQIGMIVVPACLTFWYYRAEILSRIRTLISLITILVVRMILWIMRNRALEAAEEWIKRTLLYLCLCFLVAVREYVLDLCLRWLGVIYEALLDLCAPLFLFVFGPQERRPRYRN